MTGDYADYGGDNPDGNSAALRQYLNHQDQLEISEEEQIQRDIEAADKRFDERLETDWFFDAIDDALCNQGVFAELRKLIRERRARQGHEGALIAETDRAIGKILSTGIIDYLEKEE